MHQLQIATKIAFDDDLYADITQTYFPDSMWSPVMSSNPNFILSKTLASAILVIWSVRAVCSKSLITLAVTLTLLCASLITAE